MFNLFGRKAAKQKVTDIVWATEEMKWKGIMEEWRKDPSLVIICWFEETLRQLQTVFNRETTAEVSIYTTTHLHSALLKDKQVLFAEHYPLKKKEQQFFEQLSLSHIVVFSALNEPLFLRFGGEKILQLMKQLGMQEEESINNELISKAISRAQEKIETKISTELLCSSSKEWLERNLG